MACSVLGRLLDLDDGLEDGLEHLGNIYECAEYGIV